MNVVIVDSDVSYPATSGKRLRTLNLMLPLAKRHRVTYLARTHSLDSDLKQAEEFFRDHQIEPLIIEHPLPAKKGPLFYGRLLKNLGSRTPYSVASHVSKQIKTAAQQIAARAEVDVWQVEWASHLSATPSPSVNSVLMAPNVESLIWQRSYEMATDPLRKWYLYHQWKKFEKYEQAVFHNTARVVAVSAADAQLMATRFAYNQADVVENGVDCDRFSRLECDFTSNKVLFLGALDWRPNQDALTQLLDTIFPQVLEQNPQAELLVVGRNPSAGLVDRIKHAKQVTLHADVPEVIPYLQQCAAMVVPLRIGGGSRLKILESLAAGLPVVSTSVGAEGLNLVPNTHYLQADSAPDLAHAIGKALTTPAEMQAMSQRGREVVQSHYDWSMLADKLELVWQRCAAGDQERVPAMEPQPSDLLAESLK